MFSRVGLVLIGAFYIYYQVLAAEDIYIAELLVESNVSLKATTLLSLLNTDLQVIDGSGVSHVVTLQHNQLLAECLVIGDYFSCNCSAGYIWSNEVCYNFGCCSENVCKKNISYITPLCIAKDKVYINGSVSLNSLLAWTDAETTKLELAFSGLNGFESLNITGSSGSVADFEAAFSIQTETSVLLAITDNLKQLLAAEIFIDTQGMVKMVSPETTVCYLSTPVLKCTYEKESDSSGWNITRTHQRYELNNGSVVTLNQNCATEEYKSCVQVTLNKVTGHWSGIYECGFTVGSVRHTARTQLNVALLPDTIAMEISPLTADCSETTDVSVNVTAIVTNSTEPFQVSWEHSVLQLSEQSTEFSGDKVIYFVKAHVSCQKTADAQQVTITFANRVGQKKSAKVDIPVIYANEKFCSEEEEDGLWPKTPAGDTVIIRTCEEGRVGYKSRTCNGDTWEPVFYQCVSGELNGVLTEAEAFEKGMGATQAIALTIFEGLKNSSTFDVESSVSTADVSASLNILSVMSSASNNVALQESIYPDFVTGASNMLNSTWKGVNSTVRHKMSAKFLESVEGLVKNIRVNKTNTISSPNLDARFCSGSDCTMSVFDIGVNLTKSSGLLKTVAVKNLMPKLNNDFRSTVPLSDRVIIATLEDSNSSSLEIVLDFPIEQPESSKAYCVFWNTGGKAWSDAGCTIMTGADNRTQCKCNHLTSFSVLMAGTASPNVVLDIITYTGLGVSTISLTVLLLIESLVWSVVVKTKLSLYRHTAIANIAAFLLLANCSFLASISPQSLPSDWCLILTLCKHLFFLAMFSWTLCLSVMLVHQLIFVFNPLRKRVFMFLSSVVGYACPILIVGFSYVYCKYTGKPYYDKKTCWLVYEKLLEGSLHAFLVPLATVIFINLFAMFVVIITLLKSSVPDASKADEKETAKSIFKVVIFLTPLFGITWSIGFLLQVLETEHSFYPAAEYTFTILNSFQGFFVFLTGCLTEQKVREEVLNIILCRKRDNSLKSSTLTTQTYTKDK